MTVTIRQGDCRDVLRTLPDQSVHCCVTSPPYFGLRDYGTGRWEGGDPDCDHRSPTMREGRNEDRAQLAGSAATNSAQLLLAHRSGCGKCGAVKVDSQIGLEASPDAFVSEMVTVFREVRRVLRDDGTLWLNLGDSYNNSDKWGGGGANTGKHTKAPDGTVESWKAVRRKWGGTPDIKPKDLIGIPWMVAFALRADGWYLRQDIIWHKPNPMPESVQDRCTKAHEYLFLLSKSPRYFYDIEAVKELSITNDPRRPYTSEGAWQMDGRPDAQRHGGEPRSSKGSKFDIGKTAEHQLGRASTTPRTAEDAPWEMRNRRSVWTVPTAPFSEAHFATFPPALIEPFILAGCPRGGVVLDPFFGAGTSGLVADRLQRNCVGIELNPEYAAMAEKRIYPAEEIFGRIEWPAEEIAATQPTGTETAA